MNWRKQNSFLIDLVERGSFWLPFFNAKPVNVKKYITFLFLFISILSYGQEQLSVSRISEMPDFPSPYEMRDWKTVAVDYDNFIFSMDLEGQYLPVLSLGEAGVNYPEIAPIFLDSYVGADSHGQQREAINILPAIVGATLVGIDKANHNSTNWVIKARDFYNLKNGELIYLNGPSDRSGHDWWYETMPNIFFYQLYDLYPDTPDFEDQFRTVADRWLAAVKAMGGSTAPWTVPYMNYRAWNMKEMIPRDDGVKEPEAAGAIAWILYHAYKQLGDEKYLIGAQLAMDFLNGLDQNPSYELQLPYGALTAARMNAELGTGYNMEKLVGWCFSRGNLRGWGSIVGSWDGKDVSGLIGEANDQGDDYAFLMNGFQQAAALVPLVRYDKRFATAIGKWVLNVANASRLFYAPYIDADHQSDYDWSSSHDPNWVIAYEAIKESWQGLELYARGDARDAGWAATNLALYGSSHVGYLGAIIEPTNVEGILKLDVNATNFFTSDSFPTYLIYNPFNEETQITLDVGTDPQDIYDAITETIIQTGVSGEVDIVIGAKGVLLLSYIPAGSSVEETVNRLMVENKVLDYHYGYDFSSRLRIKSLSVANDPAEIGTGTAVYCTVDSEDPVSFQWYVDGVLQAGDSNVLEWTPQEPGFVKIKVIVENENGPVADSLVVEVVELVPQNPLIDSVWTAKKWHLPEEEVWIMTRANDQKNLPLTYVWAFENGQIVESREDSVKVRLPETPGVFSVQVTVRNTYDSSAYDQLLVLVTENPSETDPLVYLPLDGDANDRSGNGYETELMGAVFVTDSLGNTERALAINGAGDELQVMHSPSLNFEEAVTVSFWVYVTDFSEERFVISHGGWEQRWKTSVTTEQKLRWTVNTSGGIKDLDSSFPLKKGYWYHFVTVYTGASMQLFVNGKLDSFISHTGTLNPADVGISIGKRLPGDSQYYLKGRVDEIRIYDTALGPDKAILLKDEWWEREVLGIDSFYQGPAIYPNPTTTHVYLQSIDTPGTVAVVDMTGRIRYITPEFLKPGLYQLNLENFSPGIYSVLTTQKPYKLIIR